MYYSAHSHNCSFLYPNPSIGNSSSEKTLNLNDIKIKRVSFEPIKTKSINAKNFVDLACVNQAHGLKMMMSIQDGKLTLITGKNKGLLREIKHQIRGRDALSHRYKATLDWPDNNISFRKLWVNRQQRLCAEVICQGQSHNVLLQLNPNQYNQDLMVDNSQCSFPLSISINSLQQDNSEYNLSSESFKIQLKSGEKADVTFDKNDCNSVRLKVGESIKYFTLPMSCDEKIIDVKPCGNWLQVTISKDNERRILYINIPSFAWNVKYPPIISSSPPLAFIHSASNNSEHFINANPFVGCKRRHIGNKFLPLNHLIDRIKHRIVSGQRKWNAGRKSAAIISFAKVLDPGVQSLIVWIKGRMRASIINEELQCKVNELDKEIFDIKSLLGYWGNDLMLLQVVNANTMRKSHISSSQTSVNLENELGKQITLATEKLKLIKPLFSEDVNAKPNKLGSWFKSQSNRIECLNVLENKPDDDVKKKLNEIKDVLDSLSKAKYSPIKSKELDLLCAFVERTILNVHLLLSLKSNPGYELALQTKLFHEVKDELTTAVQRQHFGSTAWKTAEKTNCQIGYSLNSEHNSLGKLWSRMDNSLEPDTSLADQIAAQISAMPKGDTLTLTTKEGCEGFVGVAKFGLPFVGGWFAAVLAAYEKEYSVCLESLGNGEAKLKFLRKKNKSVAGLFGTGQGFEDLTQLVKYDKGSVVTFMPFEANLILKIMQESKRDFAFNIRNEDLSETLAYLLKIKSAGSEEPTVEKWTDMQYESKQENTVQLELEFKSECRVQNGSSVSSNVFMVAPRYFAGMKASVSLEKKRSVGTKIGTTTSVEATTEWTAKAGLSHDSGSIVMPIVTGNNFGSPMPSQTFTNGRAVESEPASTKSFLSDLVSESTDNTQWSNTSSSEWESKQREQELKKLKVWLSEQSEVSHIVKNRLNSQIEILTQALNKGFHQVEKSIAAQDIGQVKVDYQASLKWKSRFSDQLRKLVRITPKHSTSLEQLLVNYPSSLRLLAAIRGSSQSQSQLENMGKASVVTAHLHYQIADKRLSDLTKRFTSETKEALENGNTKEIKVVIQRYMDILSRSNDSDRSNYRLKNISFMRTSYSREKPSGILPLITMTNYSQIELSEKLGEIEFDYEDILTTEKPISITNKIAPSLLSIPSKAYNRRYPKQLANNT
ncbi:hypothetical protein [Vibrio aestuarianus]|uniref:Uncharacterized protein n=1 Tax=Vibrio aestuarianus TaxID=28171 RepID=A0ABD7YPM5_9VIBR|nr:hypothetical protein [Vibrio aestuarianus]MDE1231361.1 hypothetical protein [Vibrio aestuarianus]WGK86940.1 hypothetical protein PYE67_18545 [Vibrio aestuarianus]CAH8238543.1 hypothetical protein VAEU17_4420032 [Vibrio aestuarianus]